MLVIIEIMNLARNNFEGSFGDIELPTSLGMLFYILKRFT